MRICAIVLLCFFLQAYDEYQNAQNPLIDTSWKQLLTTQILQDYQPPVDLINLLNRLGVRYSKNDTMQIQDLDLYLKRDISRIIGHKRLKQLFAQEQCTAFDVPIKYLVPEFGRKGDIDFDNSYVISMNVPGNFVRFWDQGEVEKLLHFAQTGVVDFYYSNIKRDNNGKNWFIDTQLEKTTLDRQYRASQQLLLNIAWKVMDYRLEDKTVDYLNTIIQQHE